MRPLPFNVSWSKVEAFRQCRKKYWFRYLSGQPSPADAMNVPGIIGNAVHRGMRVLTETLNPGFGRNEIEVYLRMPAHEACAPGTDAYTLALQCYEAGVDVHNSIESIDRWAEKDLVEAAGGSVELSARADRIDHLASGAWQVIDWKTGAEFDDKTDEQLDLAHVAMRSSLRGVMPPDAEVITVAWNLRARVARADYEPRIRILRREDAVATVGRFRAMAAQIQATTEFPAIPGRYCSFCDWRDRCPDASREAASDEWTDGE